jgi:hypothetical protein
MWGRRKADEDPFAALKNGGTFQSTPATAADMGLEGGSVNAATTSPAPAQPRPSPRGPTAYSSYPRRYTRRSFAGWRYAILVFVIAVAVIPLVSAVNHTVHSVSIPSFTTATPSSPVGPEAPSPPSPTSYLRSSSLRGALKRIAGIAPNSRLSLLRVDDHSLSTTALLRGGRAKLIYFGPAGTFVTSSPPPAAGSVSISEIDPNAINRIVAGMRHRFHVPASEIDYMVLSSLPSRGASWILFTKTPAHTGYSATLAGTGLAKL